MAGGLPAWHERPRSTHEPVAAAAQRPRSAERRPHTCAGGGGRLDNERGPHTASSDWDGGRVITTSWGGVDGWGGGGGRGERRASEPRARVRAVSENLPSSTPQGVCTDPHPPRRGTTSEAPRPTRGPAPPLPPARTVLFPASAARLCSYHHHRRGCSSRHHPYRLALPTPRLCVGMYCMYIGTHTHLAAPPSNR